MSSNPRSFDLLAGGGTATRSAFLRAARWAYVTDGGRLLGSLLVSFVLAALLGPKVFGLVAMAGVYIAFLDMMQRQGMVAAVIQRRDLDAEHADTAFWIVLASSGLMTVLGVSLAGWWAGVNGIPELQPLIVALSVLIPVQGLVLVQEALLRRRMAFRPLAVRSFTAVGLGGLVGVAGAVAGWQAWALVAQQLTTAAVSLVALWVVSDWRPRLRWSTRAARELLGFSSGSFLSALGIFVSKRADPLLIGLFFGPVAVGLYRFGARLVELTVGVLAGPAQTFALPELSPYQDDAAAFRARALRLTRLTAVVAVPPLGILAGVAAPLLGLLGRDWADSVLPLRVLCVFGVVTVATMLVGPMLQAYGRPHTNAVAQWVTAGFSAGTFVLAAVFLQGLPTGAQVTGIAVARAVGFGLVVVVVYVWALKVTVGVPARAWGAAFWPALVSACAAAGTGWAISSGLAGPGVPAAVVLVAAGAAALAVAGGVLACTSRDTARQAIALVAARTGRSRGVPTTT